jgi:hypothetical protein
LTQAWIVIAVLLPALVWYGNPAVALLAGTALSLSFRKPLAVGGHRWGRHCRARSCYWDSP